MADRHDDSAAETSALEVRSFTAQDACRTAAERLRRLGIRRVEAFAWRGLDDPDAGGSERHAHEIFSLWADEGVDVVLHTSGRPGRWFRRQHRRRRTHTRYTTVTSGGRFSVFFRVAAVQSVRRLTRRRPESTATIEIWNGMPWFGPLWAPRRRVVWMHHVHADMWSEVLPRPLAVLGRLLETRVAPVLYRRSRFVTLSASAAEQIVSIGISPEQLTVVPPGVAERVVPGDAHDPEPERTAVADAPSIVIVGRLAPVKRHVAALQALDAARVRIPALQVSIVGDGPVRSTIEEWIRTHQASSWVSLVGRLSEPELVDAYRSAALLVSASHSEGWGMSITEAGACGTPAVATDIAGHRSAIVDGVTGVLVDEPAGLTQAVADLLLDDTRRNELGRAAAEFARELSWRATAARQLDALCDSVEGSAATR